MIDSVLPPTERAADDKIAPYAEHENPKRPIEVAPD